MLSAYVTISFYGNRRQPAQFKKGRRMFSPFTPLFSAYMSMLFKTQVKFAMAGPYLRQLAQLFGVCIIRIH